LGAALLLEARHQSNGYPSDWGLMPVDAQHLGQALRSWRTTSPINATKPPKIKLGMGLSEGIDLADLLGVLGHVGEGCVVIIERLQLPRHRHCRF